MRIKWHGHACFEINTGDTTIVLDPHDGKSLGIKTPSATADLVLMSHDHYDHNASRSIQGNFKIFWNGEEITRDKFEKVRVYDMSNYAIRPEWQDGENVLEIRIVGAGEFDGATGEIYIMKA